MISRSLRLVALLLSLWLPVQSVLAVALYEHVHTRDSHSASHHAHEGNAAPADAAQEDDAVSDTSLAHAYCHLALSPGLVGAVEHAAADGEHCLHPAPTPVLGARAPDRFIRPPLARG